MKFFIVSGCINGVTPVVQDVNHEFLGGKIAKQQVASFIIKEFTQLRTNDLKQYQDKIYEIQKTYFNKGIYLEAIAQKLKEAEKRGENTEGLEKLAMQIMKGKISKSNSIKTESK